MQRAALVKGSEDKDVIRIEGNEHEAPIETITRQDGVRVSWHDGIEVVPGNDVAQTILITSYLNFSEQWSFVMAHEFFDALPIHSFEVRLSTFAYTVYLYFFPSVEDWIRMARNDGRYG